MLTGWKQIGAHMGRGVRTVQRWERNFHLPVHRPKGVTRSSVFAIPEELDKWAAEVPSGFDNDGDVSYKWKVAAEKMQLLVAHGRALQNRFDQHRTKFVLVRSKLLATTEKLTAVGLTGKYLSARK